MSNQVLKERAETLLALHQPGNPVVLPTVWDAWSARLAVDAGFAALTVGSHPMADSVGKADQEGMTFDDVVTRVKQITAAVDVPVSVDIESGYGRIAHPPDHGPAGGRRRRPQHRGHGAQRRRAAAVVQRARRARRRSSQGGRRHRRTRRDQRPHGSVPTAGRRRIRPCRPCDRAAERSRGGGRRFAVPGGPSRPGYVAALGFRAATADQRDRAARPG